MADGIIIDDLNPTVLPSRLHEVPAMKDGLTIKLTVGQMLDLLVAGAPTNLNTLVELASAIGNDPTYSATVAAALAAHTTSIAAKLPLAGGTMSGAILMAGNDLSDPGNSVADYVQDCRLTWITTTTMSVGPGRAKGNGKSVTNAATFTKSLASAWAAGTGVGGLDTGTKAANATYFLHAIRKNSDRSFDWLWSLSLTNPTIPSGYSWVTRIGICVTDASALIYKTYYYGRQALFEPIAHLSGTSGITLTGSVLPKIPVGIKVEAKIFILVAAGAGGSTTALVYYEPDFITFTATAPTIAASPCLGTTATSVANYIVQVGGYVGTDNIGRAVVAATSAGGQFQSEIHGWNDYQLNKFGL